MTHSELLHRAFRIPKLALENCTDVRGITDGEELMCWSHCHPVCSGKPISIPVEPLKCNHLRAWVFRNPSMIFSLNLNTPIPPNTLFFLLWVYLFIISFCLLPGTRQLPLSPAALCSLVSFGYFISPLFLLCLPDAKEAGLSTNAFGN